MSVSARLAQNPVVARLLEPLAACWSARGDEIIEVSINGPKDVWIQTRKDGYRRLKEKSVADRITEKWAWDLCTALANVGNRRFSETRPMLGIQLPGGHRFQALLGPNVVSGFAMSVRVRRRETIELDAYGYARDVDLPAPGSLARARDTLLPPGRPLTLNAIARAIAAGGSAFLSGSTGSGKTAFMRALLREIPANKRVITIEDVEELDVPQENQVRIVVSRTGTGTDIEYPEVIDALMRFNPDVVIPGELSTHNAEALFRLLNTGHGAFITSIHANSALDAIVAFQRNIEMRTGRSAASAVRFIAEQIDAFVHLNHRTIAEAGRGRDLNWPSLLAHREDAA